MGFNADEVADALLNSRLIYLYASCHNIPWFASATEVHQIREYFYKAWLDSERGKKIVPDN
jgi:hypothetical protein